MYHEFPFVEKNRQISSIESNNLQLNSAENHNSSFSRGKTYLNYTDFSGFFDGFMFHGITFS